MIAKITRVLGIDFGLKRIGLALSDEMKMIATPLKILEARHKLEATVELLLKEIEQHQKSWGYQLETIVVGLPLKLDGKASLMTDEAIHFIELLKTHVAIPVVSWDERLTSVLADRTMREASLTRKKRAAKVDIVSAVIILQSYLDMEGIKRTRQTHP